jgi:hypothetical protein
MALSSVKDKSPSSLITLFISAVMVDLRKAQRRNVKLVFSAGPVKLRANNHVAGLGLASQKAWP